ncbi:NASP-related protein sim3 [Fusarium oxysporum f. sp. cubense]|uniref:NASP-related protein sim3 n=1 Tax=Fusarium oxysporum f. sp. cubense TaxID=61366 RepID=A0A559L379_FUSOC|nr:NASP-related protein sim3 [Fusarium oxysporum f. sp. cubense]
MSEATEQTAPVVDETAKAIEEPQFSSEKPTEEKPAEETATPSVDTLGPSDAQKAADQAESTTITPLIGTPSVGTPNTDYLIANDQDPNSKKVTIADLSAKGSALYAHKNYEEAAEVFSRASVLQAEVNGETSPDNAEILFHYGRSLFRVGQSKSDVLGGPAASEKKKSAESKSKKPAQTEAQKVTQEGVGIVAEQKEGEKKTEDMKGDKKPLFQFTGDENFDESDEEEAEGEDEEGEEDDDLATAFEILDLARVCFMKKLELLQQEESETSGKGKEAAEGDSPTVRHVKERLADTHDALAEISLENERYPNAIEDGRTSLKYKLELYPEESEIIAEAHFKLSLALEFASVTTAGDDGANSKREEMDQGLRDEAVKEMELAIKSSKLKLQNKEVELATMASPEDNELARKSIQEMKEVIGDMEQRLVELRNDPIDAKDILGADAGPIGGILGAALGESAAETKARVDEAKKTATDLSGLVRKKNKDESAEEPEAARVPEAETNGKRKAEDPAEDTETKKAKVEA